MKKLSIITILATLLLTACLPKAPLVNDNNDNTTVCAQDAKLCPDGSYVGRTGPNCEFAPCPEVKNSPAPTEAKQKIIAPIAELRQRITKKPFGIYVTPQNSPVSPEKFTGYHTAVDVEYDDVTSDVPVYAIADGEVVRSGFVSGYGGMLAIRHTINDKKYLAIYGHLDPASIVANGTKVSQGQQIGILGDGYTKETDGERKHLHFGLYTDSDINVRGYATSKAELTKWVDPLTVLP